jgi:hypothetical protein
MKSISVSFFISSILVIFACFITVNVQLNATTLVELSLKELCKKSTDIVNARVISIQSYLSENKRRIFTDIELEVLSNIKGKTKVSQKIRLTVYGGTVNGVSTIVVGAPKFSVGEQTILFLSNISTNNGGVNYRVSGLSQGKFNVYADPVTKIEKVVRDNFEKPLRQEINGSTIFITSKKSILLQDFLSWISIYSK